VWGRTPTREIQNTHSARLRFRALLTEEDAHVHVTLG
jgi:hypothetical protein